MARNRDDNGNESDRLHRLRQKHLGEQIAARVDEQLAAADASFIVDIAPSSPDERAKAGEIIATTMLADTLKKRR